MNPEWSIQEMQHVIAEAHVSLVISDAFHVKELAKALSDLPFLTVDFLPSAHSTTATDASTEDTCVADAEGDCHRCYAMFSSGSTGAAKGVIGTERCIWNRCQWMSTFHQWHPSDRHVLKRKEGYQLL